MTHRHRRLTGTLILGLALTLPWSAAAEPRAGDRAQPGGARLAGLTSPGWLSQVWSLLSTVWAEEGCILDPDGLTAYPSCSARLHRPSPEGCILDPNGASAPAAGCIIDPDGAR